MRDGTQTKTSGDRALLEQASARLLMDEILGGPTTRGAPEVAGLVRAERIAPKLLDRLARIYGVKTWDIVEFRRAYARGALAAWKSGASVTADVGELRVHSPVCPIGQEAEADAERCSRCRALHEEVARVALGPAFRSAWFEGLVAHGDAACVFVVRHAPMRSG